MMITRFSVIRGLAWFLHFPTFLGIVPLSVLAQRNHLLSILGLNCVATAVAIIAPSVKPKPRITYSGLFGGQVTALDDEFFASGWSATVRSRKSAWLVRTVSTAMVPYIGCWFLSFPVVWPPNGLGDVLLGSVLAPFYVTATKLHGVRGMASDGKNICVRYRTGDVRTLPAAGAFLMEERHWGLPYQVVHVAEEWIPIDGPIDIRRLESEELTPAEY